MFGTAALHWPLLRHGGKGAAEGAAGGGCDDVPTVYFVFAPKKPFVDGGFRTFLRVWTVGVCLVAVVTTAVGVYVLAVGVFGPGVVGLGARSLRRGRGERSVEDGEDKNGRVYDVHAAKGYSRKARGRHTQEILACLHHSESRAIQHRYNSRTTAPARLSLWNIPWAVLLAALLVITVVCTELTVSRQGPNNNIPLDFARPPLHETSEILAFLIGLYSLVLTLLSVVGAFVAAFLRKSRRKNRQPDHHHYQSRKQEKRHEDLQ
ncbi:hypothetical protein VTK26DRAFT_2178 [Humicola hyalothermophila]